MDCEIAVGKVASLMVAIAQRNCGPVRRLAVAMPAVDHMVRSGFRLLRQSESLTNAARQLVDSGQVRGVFQRQFFDPIR